MTQAPDFRLENSELRSENEFEEFASEDLPYYSDWHGSFEKLPWAFTDEALRAADADVAIVGAPFDEGVSSRPGARFGPRAIRMAPTAWGNDAWSIQLQSEPYANLTVVDAGDAPVVPTRFERALRVIHEKVYRVASIGPVPIVLGGDHSITYPSAAAVARAVWPRTLGVIHFDAHADTGADQWGNLHAHGEPMRRLIEEGWVAGKNFVQIGLRGYWPDRLTFDWMREQGMRWHAMTEIEERGSEAVLADAIEERGSEAVLADAIIERLDDRIGGPRRCDRRGARWARGDLPVRRHRCGRSRDGSGDRDARGRRDARARAPAGGTADREPGRARGDGRGRGLAAVRSRRGDGDPRAPHGDGGDQRARRPTPMTRSR